MSNPRPGRSRAPHAESRAAKPPAVLQLDIVELLPWCRAVARGVRDDYGFLAGSQEEMELEQVAALAVVELAQRYDESRLPEGGSVTEAFKGWATVEVRSRCRRAAVQLRTGGILRTTADTELRRMRVEPLPLARGENGEECADVAIPAREETYEEPWSVYDTTPDPEW